MLSHFMNFQKENFSNSLNTIPTSPIKNIFSLLVAGCLSGCTQLTWTTSDYSGPCLPYRSLSELGEPVPVHYPSDTGRLEELGKFLGQEKESPDDEFSADDGRILTRRQILESGNQ